MSYTATLSGSFGNYAPTLGNVRVDVNGTTIDSGISTIANTGGTAFEVDATLDDDFNGPFVFYDSTDGTKYCVGSVSPIFDHTTDEVILQTATQASIDAIEADTNELQTDDIPAALVALETHGDAEWATATGFSTLNTSDIDARLNAYDAPTNSEMVAAFTEIKGAGWNSGTDTLEEIRDNVGGGGSGGATASEIADAVWDEAKADHNTSGTFGESLNNAGSGSSASDIADAIIASSATIAITSPFNPVTNSLDIIIGQTLDFTITRAFSASWSHIEFVIKDRIDSPVGDDDAILKGIVYADVTPGGLIVLNKQAVLGGTSSVVITADQPNNTTRIKVLDSITYQLTKAAKLYFTVRWVDSSSDSQSVSGNAQAGHVAAEGGDA